MSYNIKTETGRRVVAGNADNSEIELLDSKVGTLEAKTSKLDKNGNLSDSALSTNVSTKLDNYDKQITNGFLGKNLLNPNYSFASTTNSFGYEYLGNLQKYFSVIEKDSSISLSGISFGVLNNPMIIGDGYTIIVDNGVLKTTEGLCTASWSTDIKCNYFYVYPNTKEAWNKVFSKYNIQIEEGNSKTSFVQFGGLSNRELTNELSQVTKSIVKEVQFNVPSNAVVGQYCDNFGLVYDSNDIGIEISRIVGCSFVTDAWVIFNAFITSSKLSIQGVPYSKYTEIKNLRMTIFYK